MTDRANPTGDIFDQLARLHVSLKIRVIGPEEWEGAGMVRTARTRCEKCNGTGWVPMTRESALVLGDDGKPQIYEVPNSISQCECERIWIERGSVAEYLSSHPHTRRRRDN